MALTVSAASRPAPEPKALLRGHRSAVNCLAFLQGGNDVLASGDSEGNILLWSVATRRVTTPLSESHPGGVLSLSASSIDDRWLSQGRTDGALKLWRGEELVDVIRTKSESFCKASVIWRPDEAVTVACTTDNESIVAVWDVRASGSAPRIELAPSKDERWGMAMDVKLVHHDLLKSSYCVVAYEDGYLRVFDLIEGRNIPEMTLRIQHDNCPATSFCLASTLDERGLVMKGLAGGASSDLAPFQLNFRLLRSSASSMVPAFEKGAVSNSGDGKLGHGVGQITVRPDNRICAIASWDHRVRILHFRTAKHLAVLKYHRDSVYAVAFSADSNHLASGSKDQNVAIWSIYPPERSEKLDGDVTI